MGVLACHPHLKASFCYQRLWPSMNPVISQGENIMEVISSDCSLSKRGSCTDPALVSDVCPNFCLKNKDSMPSSLTPRDFKSFVARQVPVAIIVSTAMLQSLRNRSGMVTIEREARPIQPSIYLEAQKPVPCLIQYGMPLPACRLLLGIFRLKHLSRLTVPRQKPPNAPLLLALVVSMLLCWQRS